ncbi:MAG: tetratricopeptide repeat protein [Candidatus Omnitrophica bacterium]|nr:tetratricopeptide repeat protein [Candidatus Omnitrophota bacterium]
MFRQSGLESQHSGDDNMALFYFSHAAVFAPKSAEIQNDLGTSYERLGKFDDAEASYRKAIELDTKYLPAYFNLGSYYKNRLQYELAILYFKQRIAMGKANDPWTLKAQEEVEKVYSQAPQFKNMRTLDAAAELEHQFKEDKARGKITVSRQQQMDYRMMMDRGLVAYKAGNYGEAVECFENALMIKPNDAPAIHALERARISKRQADVKENLTKEARENRSLIMNKYLDEAKP